MFPVAAQVNTRLRTLHLSRSLALPSLHPPRGNFRARFLFLHVSTNSLPEIIVPFPHV